MEQIGKISMANLEQICNRPEKIDDGGRGSGRVNLPLGLARWYPDLRTEGINGMFPCRGGHLLRMIGQVRKSPGGLLCHRCDDATQGGMFFLPFGASKWHVWW